MLFRAIGGALVLAYILLRLLRSVLSPLRTVPGPFLARYTDAWYLWHVKKGRWEVRNIELHRKHGPIVRYGPNRYSLGGPEAVGTVYGHGTRFAKSSWYDAWTPPDGWNLFADRSVRRHAETRRQLQSTYSMTSLVSYEPYVDECADVFARRLSEMAAAADDDDKAADNKTAPPLVDMGHWLQCYAFDVIGQITYGERIGFLDEGADVQGIMRAIEAQLAYGTLVGIYARFHRLAFAAVNFLAGKKGAGREYVVRLTRARVAAEEARRQRRRREESGGAEEKEEKEKEEEEGEGEEETAGAGAAAEPFVSKFLAKNEQDPDRFSMQHVLAGCTANMAAGSDTTGITLSAILYHLLKRPACMRRLRAEVDEFRGRGLLSDAFGFRDTQRMPYLQAVIREALRMHPATGLPMERVVPKGGATISGRFFPEGTIVGVNSWVAHRNAEIFGEDADEFSPERWLTSDDEKMAAMNRQWIPFGVGSRTCIGRHISTLEISKLIPRIVRDFDFELSEETAENPWTTQNYWFVKPQGFKVKVTTRVQKGGQSG